MNFTIPKEKLQQLIANVMPAVQPKGAIPALGAIKLEVVPNGIILSSTDMELMLKSACKAEVKDTGSVGVVGKAFESIVKSFSGGEVKISMNNNRVKIQNGRYTGHLNVIPAEEMPPLPNYDEIEFTPAPDNFFETMDKVSFCASKDIQRYHLCGVFVDHDRMVSTDGHRLSMKPIKRKFERTFILPIATLTKISKIMVSEKNLMLHVEKDKFHFTCGDEDGGIAGSTRLIQGEYPDYSQVIPKEGVGAVFSVKKEDFKRSLNMVSTIGEANRLGVTLNFHDGVLDLSSSNPDVGESFDSIECQGSGKATVKFNPVYLVSALSHMDKEIVSLEIKDELSPACMREEDHVQVLMPMRV